MKQRIVLATVLTSLALATMAAGGGASNANGDDLAHPYFPLKVGTTWEYLSGGQVVTVKVAALETIVDLPCARLETNVAGGKVTEHLTVDKDGNLLRVRAQNQDVKPPLLLLKPAPANDDSWQIDSMVQNFALKGTLTASEDKVTVNKVELNAICVKSSGDLMMGGRKLIMETWYAKDKGMVKQHVRIPEADLDIVLELSKFTPAP